MVPHLVPHWSLTLALVLHTMQRDREERCKQFNIPMEPKEARYVFEEGHGPLQRNSYDCGVFVCAAAYCYMMGFDVNTFAGRNMEFFRQHILCSIMNKELVRIFSYPIWGVQDPKRLF